MEITIKGEPKEIAALIFAVQERQDEKSCGNINFRSNLMCVTKPFVSETSFGKIEKSKPCNPY